MIAWQGYLDNGWEGAASGYLEGITKIPRRIVGWVAGLFGWDKLEAAMSDESFNNFVDDMNKSIQGFIDKIVGFFDEQWKRITSFFPDMWNTAVDKLGLPDSWKTTGGSSKAAQAETEKAFSQSKRAKQFAENDPAADSYKNQITMTEKAIKDVQHAMRKQADAMRSGKLDPSESSVLQLKKELTELNDLLKDAREKQQTLIQNNNVVTGGGEAGGRRIPDTDSNLQIENYAIPGGA